MRGIREVSALNLGAPRALWVFVRRKIAILAVLTGLFWGVGCETTRLSEEERARKKAEELALKERYLERIQSVEEACYEVLHGLGPTVVDYNESEVSGYSGVVFATEGFYPYDLNEAVVRQGMGDFVSVRHIVEGSPADQGGLLLGDRMVSLNGRKVPRGDAATAFVREKLKKRWLVDEPNQVVVERQGEEIALEIEAEKSVHYNVVVTPFLQSEATYSGGREIYFSLEKMEGLEEEELDYVCAFALVQNVMKHARMKGQNEFIGGVLDMAAAMSGVGTGGLFSSIGRNAHKAGFNVESDLLALYALAASGIDISGYPDFWEKELAGRDGVIDRVSQERIDAMRQVVYEIEQKRLNNEPIYPTEYLSGDWTIKDLQARSAVVEPVE